MKHYWQIVYGTRCMLMHGTELRGARYKTRSQARQMLKWVKDDPSRAARTLPARIRKFYESA